MKIEVTAEDIARGAMNCADKCPVALAMKRVLGEDVLVHPYYIYARDDCSQKWLTPQAVREFICAFDNGRAVDPITFEVTLSVGIQ